MFKNGSTSNISLNLNDEQQLRLIKINKILFCCRNLRKGINEKKTK